MNVKPPSDAGSTVAVAAEKNKQWQRELLMERIRTHASQHKTFPELSKAVRMSMLEKRYALDAVEKSNLQKCLDSMQHCIKVTSRQGLVERLESLSRQLGLKFMEDTSGLFISTDMFFLEIILDASGALTDVKVHHECKIEQQSCSELVNCLNRGDFADFTVQLEGLSSIYQLNAEPKVKTKAFVAMQAMETDLYNLFQMQNFSKNAQQLLDESVVGIVLKRRGGHPMKLTYFVSPYDLISLDTKSIQTLNIDVITSKQIGLSVMVNLEASSANKLQILPTVTFAKDSLSGIEVPVYAPLTQMNSMLLPATFVLRLNKPLPVSYAALRAVGVGNAVGGGLDVNAATGGMVVSTIMSLVVQTASDHKLKNSQKGLFVCLPDQTHCYFFTENKDLKASLVSSVPFTEPVQVPKILEFLKKQALFYTLLSSCVRSQSKMGNDMDSTTILEVNAISFQQISISLQHPYDESMVTVEFDLREGSVNCMIFSLNHNYDLLSMKLTNIVQKSLSIPITIRSLLKFWDQERLKMFQRSIGGGNGSTTPGNATGNGGAFGNFSLVMSPNDPGGGRAATNAAGGSVKLEPNARQQVQNVAASASGSTSGALAGFLAYKSDIKKEDFYESPKSQSHAPPTQSVEASSLGQSQQNKQALPLQEQQTAKASDIEIADKYTNIWKDKTSGLKNCVSITAISSEPKAVQQNLDMKRSGGIEIIPFTAQSAVSTNAPSSASSTITITPINATSGSIAKDKKTGTTSGTPSSAASSSTSISSTSFKRTLDSGAVVSDAQKEKKRKKKRDDSPMGPPEKVYSRQNSPAGTSDAAATVVARKFSSPSSSPKGSSGGLIASAAGSSLSARPSPKHSPVYSSPKHNTASNSPKSPFGTHSPKHSSSGKPSMSTLKSAAATSLSPKGDKASSSNSSSLSTISGTASAAPSLVRSLSSSAVGVVGSIPIVASSTSLIAKNRDKDKTIMSPSAAASVPTSASTSASVKTSSNLGIAAMQQLKSVTTLNHLATAGNLSGFGSTAGTETIELNTAMRKSVASAVSLMTSIAATAATQPKSQPQLQHQQPHGNIEATGCPTQLSEYMVKSSQEGLKLTINKTSTKSSASKAKGSSNNSLSSNKKPHTGLKPGVNSGPASKKSPGTTTGNNNHSNSSPTTSAIKTSTTSWSPSSTRSSTHSTKHIFQKSNSSGNLTAKLSSTAMGLSKSNSTSSFGDISTLRKQSHNSSSKKFHERDRGQSTTNAAVAITSSVSQPASRLDHHVDMLKILQYASPTMAASMEGFMKGLNTKFQIPKLSQRASATHSTTMTTSTVQSSVTTSTSKSNVHSPAIFSQIKENKSPPSPLIPALARSSSPSHQTALSNSAGVNSGGGANIATPVLPPQSSVSMHILKSPVSTTLVGNACVGATVATVGNSQQQKQQLQKPSPDCLTPSAPMDDTLSSLAGK